MPKFAKRRKPTKWSSVYPSLISTNRGKAYTSLRGYERWVEYVNAFQYYTDTDLEDRQSTAYSTLFDYGHSLDISLLDDCLPHLPAVIPVKVGPPGKPKTQPVDLPADAPRHLYILDVDDLLDFTEADILAAWDYRIQICGSKEAAAELYALYRVLTEADDFYAGSAAYLEHPFVASIFKTTDDQGGANPSDETKEIVPLDGEASSIFLNLDDVRKLSFEELKRAWANRPDSFASLEAAAETLMALRAVTSQDFGPTDYRRLLGHTLIKELEDSLPLEVEAISAPSPVAELKMLREDRRVVRTQSAVVRTGQVGFRANMMARYGGQCVITGCQIDTLLEAAHIIPYRGDQSDDELNGLLLRVDIHRLFDAHLISINPETLTLELSNALNDATYRALEGKRLFIFSPKPRRLYLTVHYQQFKAKSATISSAEFADQGIVSIP